MGLGRMELHTLLCASARPHPHFWKVVLSKSFRVHDFVPAVLSMMLFLEDSQQPVLRMWPAPKEFLQTVLQMLLFLEEFQQAVLRMCLSPKECPQTVLQVCLSLKEFPQAVFANGLWLVVFSQAVLFQFKMKRMCILFIETTVCKDTSGFAPLAKTVCTKTIGATPFAETVCTENVRFNATCVMMCAGWWV